VLGDLRAVYHRTCGAHAARCARSVVGIYILARPRFRAAFALVIAFWALFAAASRCTGVRVEAMMKHWWVLLLAACRCRVRHRGALQLSGALLTFAVVMVSWWLTLTASSASTRRHAEELGMQGLDSRVRRAERRRGAVCIARPDQLAAIMGLIAAFALVSGVAFVVGAFKLRSVVHRSADLHAITGDEMGVFISDASRRPIASRDDRVHHRSTSSCSWPSCGAIRRDYVVAQPATSWRLWSHY